MERKLIKIGGLAGGGAVVIALLCTAGTFGGFLSPALGTSPLPYFAFSDSSNRLYSGSSAGSGSTVARSGTGTEISYEYSWLKVVSESSWQTIESGGYFTNNAPIHGMSNLICELSSGGSVQVYWSDTPTFNATDSATYSANFTCTFSSYPNFIKVVALADTTIPSASIGFGCVNTHHTLGSSFYLGKYSQTVVEYSTLINSLSSATDTDGDGYLEYGGNEYKVATGHPAATNITSNSGTLTFVIGATYYFKVEPIEWRDLSGTGAVTGLLVSEKLLTIGSFYNGGSSLRTISGSQVYPNNHEYSDLRAMLNGYDGHSYSAGNYTSTGFLKVAFTDAEKGRLLQFPYIRWS